jgi:hypothetical protein
MTAVQLMCARLGIVTGLGLAGVIRRRDATEIRGDIDDIRHDEEGAG